MTPRDKWWYRFDIVSMIDPASGQEGRNCESAIVTVGGEHLTERSEIYVLDARAGHWRDQELLSQMFLVHDIYQSDHVGIEDATHQQWMVTMSELSQDKPISFHLEPHNSLMHGRKKRHRLQKAANHIHLVRFKQRDQIQDRLIDQLVTFQGNRNDKFDLGDAFCMAINEFHRFYPPHAGFKASTRYVRPIFDSTGQKILRYAEE